MRSNFRRGGKRRIRQQNLKNENTCICIKCGYSQAHIGASPCRNVTCPVCGTTLIRGMAVQAQQIEISKIGERDKDILPKHSSHSEIKKIKGVSEFPQIKTEICTGCGICIDACRLGAISLQNGVAVIDTEKCVNCRICEGLCPSRAIM